MFLNVSYAQTTAKTPAVKQQKTEVKTNNVATTTGLAPVSKASASTKAYNNNVKKTLNFEDTEDFVDSQRGLIASFSSSITDQNLGKERIVWDFASYSFIKGEAPDSVNPSLWRNAILNNYNGLFKVAEKVYQVRGSDLANMTIIEAPKGLILIDVMTVPATAKAALDLYYQHRPKVPVVAVIYTHSHADHFGGVRGVVNEEDVKKGKVKIYAPSGFLEHAISENIYAGNAMIRRSMYGYGGLLPKGPEGQIDGGLGKTVALGSISLIAPTDELSQSRQVINIAGLNVDFYMAHGTEAPSEMFMYFPDFKMIQGAEVVSHTLHNLYTLRGAQVRDSTAWWKAINAMIDEYGEDAEILTASHHWPTWGRDKIVKYLANQRDMYKSLHDQTLYYANQGYTSTEIVDKLVLPQAIFKQWYNRGYYGSISHDVKGIYQRYLGWFDGNPANLDPLPAPLESKKYVEALGGVQKAIAVAQKAYDQGDYRWSATLLKHVVFADPNNKNAKELLAKSFDQMGYQAESATWRNIYLMGAYELRNGKPLTPVSDASVDITSAMTIEMYFDYLAITLNPEKLQDINANFNWIFSDTNQQFGISINHSVFTYSKKLKKNPDATITMKKSVWNDIMLQKTTLKEQLEQGNVKIEGSIVAFKDLASASTKFDPLFNIVTP